MDVCCECLVFIIYSVLLFSHIDQRQILVICCRKFVVVIIGTAKEFGKALIRTLARLVYCYGMTLS